MKGRGVLVIVLTAFACATPRGTPADVVDVCDRIQELVPESDSALLVRYEGTEVCRVTVLEDKQDNPQRFRATKRCAGTVVDFDEFESCLSPEL